MFLRHIQPTLNAYIAGICRKQGSQAFHVGGIENHIHIACTLPRTISISKLLQEIKQSSSSWMKDRDTDFRNFAWQSGYGAFSIGHAQLSGLIHYIEEQEMHHAKRSFEEEYLELLKLYGVEYDEQYIWD